MKFDERPAVCAKSLLVLSFLRSQPRLSLMQAFPIFTKYVNHWFSNNLFRYCNWHQMPFLAAESGYQFPAPLIRPSRG